MERIAGETDVEMFVLKLPRTILEVHFSDNFGDEDSHKELGCGNLNIESLLRAIYKRDECKQFTLEFKIDFRKKNCSN